MCFTVCYGIIRQEIRVNTKGNGFVTVASYVAKTCGLSVAALRHINSSHTHTCGQTVVFQVSICLTFALIAALDSLV